MMYKQKEQHHIYQISPTNEHTAEMQLLEVGFTWTQTPECNTEAEEKNKKLQDETNEATQLQSHQSNTALGKYPTASHLIYRDKC